MRVMDEVASDCACLGPKARARVSNVAGQPDRVSPAGEKETEIKVERKVSLYRFAVVKTKVATIFFAGALSVFSDNGLAQQTYPGGFNVAADRAGELSEALPAKFGDMLAQPALTLQAQTAPQITPVEITSDDGKVLRQVYISAGFVSLVNHLAHAKAIDRIQPGFFDQYMQNLALMDGTTPGSRPPDMVDARYWTDDVMNDQASFFNQMMGMMVSINLSHLYLGHCDKYMNRMIGPGNKFIPINNLLTSAEWEVSVKAGATDALNCALATEGAKAIFDAIGKMPQRPAWTDSWVPKSTDLKRLNKELSQYETQFFHGGLKFSFLNELQIHPLGNEPLLMSLSEKPFDGLPSFVAVVQSPMIDIHADEFVSQFHAHVPGVLQGVGHSFGTVIETELNAVVQNPRYN
jgi:hypothetical protein